MPAFQQPYLCHYSTAFAFSAFLYPQHIRLPLRLALPILQAMLRAYHVPHFQPGRLGSLCSPGVLLVHDRSLTSLFRLHCPFGSSLFTHLRLVRLTTFIKRSHLLAILPILALSLRRFREFGFLAKPAPAFQRSGFVRGAVTRDRYPSPMSP